MTLDPCKQRFGSSFKDNHPGIGVSRVKFLWIFGIFIVLLPGEASSSTILSIPRCYQPTDSMVVTHPCLDIMPVPDINWDHESQGLEYRLAVHYVLPIDILFDQQVLNRIKAASYDIQAWYQVASGGLTWEFAYPEVVHLYNGANTHQYYFDHGNWWGSLLPEMDDAGYPIWEPGIVTALWVQWAGWWAGAAYGCEAACGIALLGIELFPEFNNPAWSGGICPDPVGQGVDAWPCTPVGAFTQELGHTVGLIHPLDDPITAPYALHSILQTHWYYPDEAPQGERPWGLLRNERYTLRSSPYMKLDLALIQPFDQAEIVVNLPISGTIPSVSYNILIQSNLIILARMQACLIGLLAINM